MKIALMNLVIETDNIAGIKFFRDNDNDVVACAEIYITGSHTTLLKIDRSTHAKDLELLAELFLDGCLSDLVVPADVLIHQKTLMQDMTTCKYKIAENTLKIQFAQMQDELKHSNDVMEEITIVGIAGYRNRMNNLKLLREELDTPGSPAQRRIVS